MHADLLCQPLADDDLTATWLEFYATRNHPWPTRDMVLARSRLMLHYAPYAKYWAYRYAADGCIDTAPMIATALIAVGKALDARPDGELDDWMPNAVQVIRNACEWALANDSSPAMTEMR